MYATTLVFMMILACNGVTVPGYAYLVWGLGLLLNLGIAGMQKRG